MIGEQADVIRAGSFEEIARRGWVVVSGGAGPIAVFYHEGKLYAVDNRCPHMGFPLSKGSLCDGVLTCHWHHARFDLESGGTFDPFADDLPVYPTVVRDGEVYVDRRAGGVDRATRSLGRLRDGLEQNLSLVTIKSILAARESGVPSSKVLEVGADFGARYREAGWGPGLTILTAMGNVLDALAPEDHPLALFHGLVHVAEDCSGQPPRFGLDPLPTRSVSLERLKVWFRRFVQVRDEEGAERVLLTAISGGHGPATVADLLLSAATDHFFLAGGHSVDFINKAFELLDRIGWDRAGTVLPSLIRGLCRAQRSEESNAWRHPVDLVALLDPVLARLPELTRSGETHRGSWNGLDDLATLLLGDDPEASVNGLVTALENGAATLDLSGALAYAAALRVARFHTSNEFGDWITVLHTFSYANALHQCLKRSPSPEALRGVFHGAARLYLDRFLNVPAAALPSGTSSSRSDDLLGELLGLLDRQQEVNAAGALAYRYLAAGHPVDRLIQTLGRSLLREDAEFHSYQMFEAGLQQYRGLSRVHPTAAAYVLVGVARYLAAHAPTARSLLQTARIATRLQRGDDLTVAEE